MLFISAPATLEFSMKISYLAHEYPKYTETFVYREVERLHRLGIDALVLAMKRPERTGAIEGAEKLIASARYLDPDFGFRFWWAQAAAFLKAPLRYVGLLTLALRSEERRSGVPLRIRLGFFLRGALAAWLLGRERDISLLHCPATGDELVAAHVASVLSGIPLSFTLHAPLALFLESPLLKKHARDAALIIAISEDARRRIVELAGEEVAGRVKIIHCGVDLPENVYSYDKTRGLNPLSEERCFSNYRVISVASLSRFKGHDVLIRAMGLLAGRGVTATCEIVGEGEERARLEALIRELGIRDRVKLLGGKPPDVVGELLKSARCFVLASRVDERGHRDGIPVALMEAMARSVPCVASGISGIPELIKDGETGLLVAPENPAALADAIQKLLDDPDMAGKIAERGRKWVAEQFSLDEGARLVAREFNRLAHSIVYISHEYPKVTETFIRREVEALRRAGLHLIVYSFRNPKTRGLNPLSFHSPKSTGAYRRASREETGPQTVYLPRPGSINFIIGAFRGIMRRPLRASGLLWRAAVSRGEPGEWRAGWGGVLDVLRGAWIAGRMGPQVAAIHGSFAGVAATATWAAGGLADIPFGFSSHTSPPDPLLKRKCRDASWIFSESDYDRRYISGIAGERISEKINIVKCGLDPEEFPEPDWASDRYSSGNALFVGTLGPKKGVIPLIEALIHLSREGSDIKLDVVGDGPLSGKMRSMLGAEHLEGRVRFYGELPFEAVRKIYYRSRFIVLPAVVTPEGDRDGIPVALMEGMASGLAAITTPVSGIPELVDDSVTGIMAPPSDSAALAQAMKTLWDSPDMCRRMGKNGRDKVLRVHTLNNQAASFLSGLFEAGVIPPVMGNSLKKEKV